MQLYSLWRSETTEHKATLRELYAAKDTIRTTKLAILQAQVCSHEPLLHAPRCLGDKGAAPRRGQAGRQLSPVGRWRDGCFHFMVCVQDERQAAMTDADETRKTLEATRQQLAETQANLEATNRMLEESRA